MFRSVFLVAIFVINGIYAETDCSFTFEDLNKCCALPAFFMAEKCLHHLKSEASIEDKSCYVECLLNETDVILNGAVNIASLKTFFEKNIESGSDFLNIFMNSLDVCIPYAREKLSTEGAAAQGLCSPFPRNLMECVAGNSFFNCPTNKWTASDECSALRERVKTCYKI